MYEKWFAWWHEVCCYMAVCTGIRCAGSFVRRFCRSSVRRFCLPCVEFCHSLFSIVLGFIRIGLWPSGNWGLFLGLSLVWLDIGFWTDVVDVGLRSGVD